MSGNNELTISSEEYDKAFTEVSFLLDMFVDTIGVFVGKSTPSLAVAAGRKMAANLPIHLSQATPETALAELVRVFRTQQMEIEGRMENGQAIFSLQDCPIGSVCKNRQMELDGQACQMFHYYIAGIMAELTGVPARPKTIEVGASCTFNVAFSGVRRPA